MLIFQSSLVAADLIHSLQAYYVYIVDVIGDIFPNVMTSYTNLYMWFIWKVIKKVITF